MNKQYKQLISNTGIFAAAKMGAKIVILLLLPLYTNVLTKTEYGTTELLLTYANLLVPILSLSIQEAVFRFGLDKKSDKNGILTNAVSLTFVLSVISAVIVPIVATWLRIGEYKFLFVILIISMMFRQIFNIFLKACDKNALFAVDTVIYSFSLGVFNIVFLVVIGLKVDGYMYALILSNISSILFCVIAGKVPTYIKINTLNKKLLQEMMMYSIPLILNQISWWISNSSDRYIMSRMDSVASVGVYSAAAKIPAIISNLISVFIQAWVISAIYQYKEKNGKEFFENIFQLFHFGLVMGTNAILLFLKVIVKLLIGKEFVDAYFYIPALLLASFYLGYAYFWGVLYTAEKKNVAAMTSTVVAAIVNIVLDVLMIHFWGIQGACIATCISHFVLAMYRIIDTRKIFKFDFNIKKTLLSNALMIVGCFFVVADFYPIISVIVLTIMQIILYRTQWIPVVRKVIK